MNSHHTKASTSGIHTLVESAPRLSVYTYVFGPNTVRGSLSRVTKLYYLWQDLRVVADLEKQLGAYIQAYDSSVEVDCALRQKHTELEGKVTTLQAEILHKIHTFTDLLKSYIKVESTDSSLPSLPRHLLNTLQEYPIEDFDIGSVVQALRDAVHDWIDDNRDWLKLKRTRYFDTLGVIVP